MDLIRCIANRVMAVQAENAAPVLGMIGAVLVFACQHHGLLP